MSTYFAILKTQTLFSAICEQCSILLNKVVLNMPYYTLVESGHCHNEAFRPNAIETVTTN